MFKNVPTGGNIIEYIYEMSPQNLKIDMDYFKVFGTRENDSEKFFKIVK